MHLTEVDAALERIDKGTFGHCKECGRHISHKRLQAIPFARRCIECTATATRGSGIAGQLVGQLPPARRGVDGRVHKSRCS